MVSPYKLRTNFYLRIVPPRFLFPLLTLTASRSTLNKQSGPQRTKMARENCVVAMRQTIGTSSHKNSAFGLMGAADFYVKELPRRIKKLL
jgi:hypothetical protein